MPDDKPSLTALLTDPDAFFRARSENPSIVRPLAIVTLIAVVGSFAAVIQNETIVPALRPALESAIEQTMENTSDNASENVTQSDVDNVVNFAIQAYLAISYGAALIGPFFFWLLYGIAFHAISVVFDGEGSFSRTMTFVGWGRVPALVSSVLTLGIYVYYYEIAGIDVASDVTAGSEFEALNEIGPPAEVQLLTALLGVVFTLWAAYIWVYAMAHARDLSRRQAVLTVSVPILLSLLFQIQSVFGAL